jgi:hypothetical protein
MTDRVKNLEINNPLRRRFAWLPVRVSEYEKVWMEHYWYRRYELPRDKANVPQSVVATVKYQWMTDDKNTVYTILQKEGLCM